MSTTSYRKKAKTSVDAAYVPVKQEESEEEEHAERPITKRKKAASQKDPSCSGKAVASVGQVTDLKSLVEFSWSQRARVIRKGAAVKEGGIIAYWMNRDQRVHDNWALLYAQKMANESKNSLAVVFSLGEIKSRANSRQMLFMLKGLEEIESTLTEQYKIPFVLLDSINDPPSKQLASFVNSNGIQAIITDFSPLKPYQTEIFEFAKKVSPDVSVHEVDAHNIVPVWQASNKLEWAARTIRPKIHKLLPEYLTEFPKVERNLSLPTLPNYKKVDWTAVAKSVKTLTDGSEIEPAWITPGEKASIAAMKEFFENRLKVFSTDRNDPSKNGLSHLSPYLHFGHLSAQRVALEAANYKNQNPTNYASFVEELVVRRELSDNYCHYNAHYDSYEGFPDWARKTLEEHKHDKREVTYTLEKLEKGQTYDDLWNASQQELIKSGKMHGFMRMYWAKKILEWTKSAQDAFKYALYLNDKYELDGRDPNGFVGCAWSIGGVHDRAWTERQVFGKIRYMNYEGCKRKFDVSRYLMKVARMK